MSIMRRNERKKERRGIREGKGEKGEDIYTHTHVDGRRKEREREKSIKATPHETEETERSCTRTKPTNHHPPSPFEISNVRFLFDTYPYHPFIFTNFFV